METPYVETEALLMVMRGEHVADISGYLWEHITLNELDELVRALRKLHACVEHVSNHKRHATEHLPDCGEVATPGEG